MTYTYLPQPTIDSLRALDEQSMRTLCDIHRPLNSAVNEDNSPADNSEYVQTGIPCRFTISLLRASESLLAFGISGEIHGFLRVPIGTDVLTSDYIAYAGNQYEIVGTNLARTLTTSIQLALRMI